MKRYLAALMVTGCCIGAAQAGSDPVATLQAIYKPYLVKNAEIGDILSPKLYSARRRTEIRAMQAACPKDDQCGPDFDFFINGQDFELSDLQIKLISSTEKQATVDVRFKNFGTQDAFIYTLVEEKGDWRIDQLKGGDKDTQYDLDTTLKPQP